MLQLRNISPGKLCMYSSMGRDTFLQVQPVTRQNACPLDILLWSHPVILETLVSASKVRTLITLTSPTVVAITKIAQTAQVSVALDRVKSATPFGKQVVMTKIIKSAHVSVILDPSNSASPIA